MPVLSWPFDVRQVLPHHRPTRTLVALGSQSPRRGQYGNRHNWARPRSTLPTSSQPAHRSRPGRPGHRFKGAPARTHASPGGDAQARGHTRNKQQPEADGHRSASQLASHELNRRVSWPSVSDSALRANPFPEVTDQICRLPLPTLFYCQRLFTLET